jgi:hypothetical protein
MGFRNARACILEVTNVSETDELWRVIIGLRSVPVLSDVIVTFFSAVVLTPNGNF